MRDNHVWSDVWQVAIQQFLQLNVHSCSWAVGSNLKEDGLKQKKIWKTTLQWGESLGIQVADMVMEATNIMSYLGLIEGLIPSGKLE